MQASTVPRFPHTVFALFLPVAALMATGCNNCNDEHAQSLNAVYRVKFNCARHECRAKLTSADAARLGAVMSAGGLSADVAQCRDVSARPDAHSSGAVMNDPCCSAGGSACTHFYQYAVSASAGEMCVAL
jgi:hypothetical protein